MIKNPQAVGAVRIHMDPESIDTSFEDSVNTFLGVVTLLTPAGSFKMEGPPCASLQIPTGYEDRPVQRKTPSRNHGQRPRLQVVFFGRFFDRPN